MDFLIITTWHSRQYKIADIFYQPAMVLCSMYYIYQVLQNIFILHDILFNNPRIWSQN
jgi:hypothetical protein